MVTTSISTMTDLIAQYAAHMAAGGKARTTIRDRTDLLRRVDTDLPMGLEAATVEELAAWLAREEWLPATRKSYYWHIRGFFVWACDPNRPLLDWDPSASLSKPRVPAGVPKPVTNRELEIALADAGEPWDLLVLLAAYAGLRCCELATIRREHVTEDTITIRGKGGKERSVPTAAHVWDRIRDLPRGRLGPREDAHWIAHTAIRRFTRIGLEGVTMHRFRHWFGTTLLAGGADLLTVSKLLGHANTATTAVYCLITDGQRRSAVATLPVLTATPASR